MKWKKTIRLTGVIVAIFDALCLWNTIGGTWAYTIDNIEEVEQARLVLLLASLISLSIALMSLFIIRKEATKKKNIISIALLILAFLVLAFGTLVIAI